LESFNKNIHCETDKTVTASERTDNVDNAIESNPAPAVSNSLNCTYFYKDIKLWQKHRRSAEHNKNVSESRCFEAVRFEVVASLAEYFTRRIPDSEFKELEPLRHILPTTTDNQLRECHKTIIPDMPLGDFVSSYREVCDQFSVKTLNALNPRDVITLICKTECWQTMTVALARLLAAKPHSADVERLISSYNQLKTYQRSALSASSLSANLFIRHNMPPVAQWDPRPAIYHWMTKKDRRPDQNPSEAKKQDYFKGVFF
jgi:hypothetical protein